MRVIYYSQTFFSDCDFPLIRDLQNKGIDVYYYMPINHFLRRQGIIDIKNLKSKIGIYKASHFEELDEYKHYIDLEKIYFINIPKGTRKIYQYIIWMMVFLHMFCLKANVFHFTWQLSGLEKILYYLPIKKTMTVHDPLSHSSVTDEREEINRKKAFSMASSYVLLSRALLLDFCEKYHIQESQIHLSHLGEFDHLRFIASNNTFVEKPFISFLGQITSSKGIEYLCEAMVKVHESFPDVKLLIAGRGNMYFDYSPYENKDYIVLENKFLSISEIASILKNTLFVVLPYKDATQSGVVQTAFSCNTPLIVTNVGGLPEAVTDNVTGLVVPPNDSSALATAIERLLSNKSLLERFKSNIDTIWRPTMDWNSISEDFITVWQK